jgi:hypothetical protein
MRVSVRIRFVSVATHRTGSVSLPNGSGYHCCVDIGDAMGRDGGGSSRRGFAWSFRSALNNSDLFEGNLWLPELDLVMERSSSWYPVSKKPRWPARSCTRATSFVSQRLNRIQTRRFHGRPDSEKHSHCDRYREPRRNCPHRDGRRQGGHK